MFADKFGVWLSQCYGQIAVLIVGLILDVRLVGTLRWAATLNVDDLRPGE